MQKICAEIEKWWEEQGTIKFCKQKYLSEEKRDFPSDFKEFCLLLGEQQSIGDVDLIGIFGGGISCSFESCNDLDLLTDKYLEIDDSELEEKTTNSNDEQEDVPVGKKRELNGKEEPNSKFQKVDNKPKFHPFWRQYKYKDIISFGEDGEGILAFGIVVLVEQSSNEFVFELVWCNSEEEMMIPFGYSASDYKKFVEGDFTDVPEHVFEEFSHPAKDRFTQWLKAYHDHLIAGNISTNSSDENGNDWGFHFPSPLTQKSARAPAAKE